MFNIFIKNNFTISSSKYKLTSGVSNKIWWKVISRKMLMIKEHHTCIQYNKNSFRERSTRYLEEDKDKLKGSKS